MPATPRELDQIRALLALAANDATPHAEAAVAAIQAARRIHRHDLLSLEAAKTARDLVREAEEDAREARARGYAQGGGAAVRIDAILMIMTESPTAYRFARMRPNFRTAGSPVIGWIRKRLIYQIVWASEATTKIYSTSGRRIAEAILVPAEVAGAVRKIVMGEAV